MKFYFLLSALFILIIPFDNAFAHDPGEPINIKCFITNISVMTVMPPHEECYKDKIPEGWNERKVSSLYGCMGTIEIGYHLGSHDLDLLRNIKKNELGYKMYDMKTEISFENGKLFKSVTKFNPQFGLEVTFSGEKMLKLYSREEPIGVECEIL
jgi:hypothetical protein